MDMQGAKSARDAKSSARVGSDTGSAAPAPTVKRRSAAGPNDPISSGLRKLWDDVALEPVPDDFLALLDKIQTDGNAADPKSDVDPEKGTSP